MAKYTVTYRCGHTAEVELFGKYEDRERKIAYYKTIDCPECRAKAREEEAAANGYATLTGSEKQVRWANDIRAKKLADAEAFAAKITRNKEIFDGALNKMKSETSASWWIDRRYNEALEIVKEIITNK